MLVKSRVFLIMKPNNLDQELINNTFDVQTVKKFNIKMHNKANSINAAA